MIRPARGFSDRALERVDSLPGGRQQRVGIARMLMQRPAFMLADEPDTSLDPQTGEPAPPGSATSSTMPRPHEHSCPRQKCAALLACAGARRQLAGRHGARSGQAYWLLLGDTKAFSSFSIYALNEKEESSHPNL